MDHAARVRQIRAQLAITTRWHPEEAEPLRRELTLLLAEGDLARRLDGMVLTREECQRLIDGLLERRDRAEMEAEARAAAAEAYQLVQGLRAQGNDGDPVLAGR